MQALSPPLLVCMPISGSVQQQTSTWSCAGTLADQHKETVALIILGVLDLVAALMCLGDLALLSTVASWMQDPGLQARQCIHRLNPCELWYEDHRVWGHPPPQLASLARPNLER